MPALKIVSGMNAGQTFEITGNECVIGREPICEVVLNSRTVSRQHARILHEADGYYLEDLRSVNGTALNGQRIDRRTRLQDFDQILIYDTVLAFREELSTRDIAVLDDEPPVAAKAGLSSSAGSGPQPIFTEIDARSAEVNHLDSQAGKKLSAILQISRNLGSSLDVNSLLPKILDSLFQIFPQAQRGYILQSNQSGGELTPTAIKHRGDASDTISPIGGTVAQRVMSEGAAFLSGDVLSDERLEELNSSIFDEPVRSIMCAPMMGPSKTAMGVIHLETGDPREPFGAPDLEVLVAVGFLAGQSLEYARLHESLMELDWRRREIALAKDVQLRFLPERPPKVDGYRFYQHYLAADSVAGDYFDYIALPDHRMAIVQGDVSGKGVSAALLVARLCSDVRYCLLSSQSLSAAAERLNQQVCEEVKNSAFITMLLFVLDYQRHELTLVNAGHPAPFIRYGATGKVEPLCPDVAALPVGVRTMTQYQSATVTLQPGDLVLACTDGVFETVNPEGKLYGTPAVAEVVARTKPVPNFVGQALLADIRHFAQGRLQADDICVLSFARETPAA